MGCLRVLRPRVQRNGGGVVSIRVHIRRRVRRRSLALGLTEGLRSMTSRSGAEVVVPPTMGTGSLSWPSVVPRCPHPCKNSGNKVHQECHKNGNEVLGWTLTRLPPPTSGERTNPTSPFASTRRGIWCGCPGSRCWHDRGTRPRHMRKSARHARRNGPTRSPRAGDVGDGIFFLLLNLRWRGRPDRFPGGCRAKNVRPFHGAA